MKVPKAGSTEGDGQTYKAKLVSLDNIRLICLDKNQKKYLNFKIPFE